jgi:hypothetical protein
MGSGTYPQLPSLSPALLVHQKSVLSAYGNSDLWTTDTPLL